MQMKSFFHKYKGFLLIPAVLLVVLFLLCSSMLIHTIDLGGYDTSMTCVGCEASGGEQHTGPSSTHMTAYLVSGVSVFALAVAVIAFFLSSLLFSQRGKASMGLNYIRSVRDRYGGFGVLNYFLPLFSKGILHSKVFSLTLVS